MAPTYIGDRIDNRIDDSRENVAGGGEDGPIWASLRGFVLVLA